MPTRRVLSDECGVAPIPSGLTVGTSAQFYRSSESAGHWRRFAPGSLAVHRIRYRLPGRGREAPRWL